MKYLRKSFSVAGPIKVTDAEWDRIFGKRGPAAEVAIKVDAVLSPSHLQLRRPLDELKTLREARSLSQRAKLLLAEMQLEALRKGH